MTTFPSPIISELKRLLPQNSWAWVIPALKQDALIWESLHDLQGTYGVEGVAALIHDPDDCSPAALALRALKAPVTAQWLRGLPMQPLQEDFRTALSAAREPGAPPLHAAAALALDLREARRQTPFWNELSTQIEAAPVTALACAYGLIPDQIDMLRTLLATQPADVASDPRLDGAIERAVHILLSHPQPPEALLEILAGLLGELSQAQKVAFLERLSFRRPDLSPHLTQLLPDSPRPLERKAPASINERVDTLSSFYMSATVQRLSRQGALEISDLSKSLQEARRLEAQLAAQLALTAQRNGDVQTCLEAWQQAAEQGKEQPDYQAGYILALIDAGNLEAAQQRLDACAANEAGATHPLFDLCAAWLQVKASTSSGAAQDAQALAAKAESALQFLERLTPNLHDEAELSDPHYIAHLAVKLALAAIHLERPHLAIAAAHIANAWLPNDPQLVLLLAQSLHEAGQHNEAIQAAHLAVALSPESLPYRRYLVDSLEVTGEWQEALKEHEGVIAMQAEPQSTDWHALAAVALRLNQPERAIQASMYALKTDENDGIAHAILGEAASAQGNLDEANQRLRQAIELASDHAYPWLAMARLQRKNGETVKALETLRTAAQSTTNHTEIQLSLGEMYLDAEAPTQALSPLQQSVERLRRPPDIAGWLPDEYSTGRYSSQGLEAISESAFASLKHNQDIMGLELTRGQLAARAALYLGNALTQLGRLDEALQVLEDAHRAFPANLSLAYQYARCLIAQDKTSQALFPLEAVVNSQPDDASPYLDYALCLLAQPANSPASERRGTLSPISTESQDGTGTETSPNLSKAIASLERALELEPGRAEAKAMLAEVWAGQGESSKAYDALCELWQSDLARDSVWKTRLALRLGQVAQQVGKGETAVTTLLDADPDNPLVQKQLAEAYFSMGLYDAAYKAAQTAYNLQPADLEILLWFARFALDLLVQPKGIHPNVKGEVLSAVKRAIELCPQRGDLLVFLGQMQARFGEADNAKHTFHKLVSETAKDPSLEIEPRDYYQAAQSLLEMGDHAIAALCLENALRAAQQQVADGESRQVTLAPSPYELLTSLALAYRKTGDLTAALKACDQAIALEPGRGNLYLEKADLLLQMNQAGVEKGGRRLDAYRPVAEWLETAAQEVPDDPAIHFYAAHLHRLTGDLPGALDYANRLVESLRPSPAPTSPPEVPTPLSRAGEVSHPEAASIAADLLRALLRHEQAWKVLETASVDELALLGTSLAPAHGESGAKAHQAAYLCLHAECALDSSQDAIATNDLAILLEQPSAGARALAIQARLAARRGDLKNAAGLLKSALQSYEKGRGEGGSTPERPLSLADVHLSFIDLAEQRSIAIAAAELAEWEVALPALERLASIASLEPLAHLDLAWALVSRAERQVHYREINSISHAPGATALSDEARQAFETSLQAARALIEQTPGAASPSAEDSLTRCSVRGAAVFQPDRNAAQAFANLERSPEDTAAYIACLREIGDLAEASLVAREHPHHPMVLLQLALALANDKPRQALVAAQTAVDVLRGYEDSTQPSTGEAPIHGGVQLLPLAYALEATLARASGNRAGDASVALTAIHNALELWPDEPRWHHLAGEIYLMHDETAGLPEHQSAAAHFQQALALEPGNPMHYIALGKLHLKDKEYRLAIDNFERATRLSPSDANLWQLLARAYTDKGDIQQAASAAERAVSLMPGAFPPALLRAEIAIKGGDFERAEADLRKILEENPNNNAALLVLSKALAAQNKHEQALQLLDNAIREEADVVPVDVERARLIKKTKGAEEAIRTLEAVISRDPSALEPYVMLAEIFDEAGRGQDALSLAQRALSLKTAYEPEISWEDTSRLHSLLGRLYHQNGQLEQAVQHLSEAIRLAPKMVEAYLELGKVHCERRQHHLALEVYRKAISTAPYDPQAYYQAGLVYKESKDYQEAERMLRLAAKLAPDDLAIQRHLGAIVALNLVHNRSV